MAIKRSTKVDPSFSMSSMTDIVFLLLIFFLGDTTIFILLGEVVVFVGVCFPGSRFLVVPDIL